MNKLIINFTPTGMVPTRDLTPHVPISAAEIVDEILKANELGITIAHIHAREEKTGQPCYKIESYAKIIEPLRKYAPELVLCISLSGRNFPEFEYRSQAIELRPDLASLTLSSLNFAQQASVNSPEMIQRLCQKMIEYQVKPELEVFDLGMINYAKYLMRKKLIGKPFYFNIILGNIAGLQCNFHAIGSALQELPPESIWSLGGIGQYQLKANTLAIASNGGVRVGIEDNLYYDAKKTRLASNIDLLRRIHKIAEMFERDVMSPKEFGMKGFYNNSVRKTVQN